MTSKTEILNHLKSGQPQLSIGTLTGDMMNQAGDLQLLEESGINLLHLDVMDGQAWPKITVGPGFLAGLKTPLFKDVHLLIASPENHIDGFVAAGADAIVFAMEHSEDVELALSKINEAENVNNGSRGVLAGVSIYPSTPLEELKPHLDALDVVTVLAIGPDTGKEAFFDKVAERIKQLRAWKPELVIAVDGAVKVANVGDIAQLNPDLIVTGSAVFDGKDPSGNIASMKKNIEEALGSPN